MKTNIQIELNDDQRNTLANVIDGKESKRLAKRIEVVDLCFQHIHGLLGSAENRHHDTVLERGSTMEHNNPLYEIDPGDEKLMARPNDPGYVRGWNTYKRARQAQGVKFQ